MTWNYEARGEEKVAHCVRGVINHFIPDGRLFNYNGKVRAKTETEAIDKAALLHPNAVVFRVWKG